MNRREEYELLKDEMNFVEPIRENSIEKAKRKKRKNLSIKYAGSFLASIVVLAASFVILVNSDPKIALAAMKIPGVEKLLEVISYSDSLVKMVKNDHVQYILEEEEKNGITVYWDSLIVDEGRANLVVKIDSPKYLNSYQIDLQVIDPDKEKEWNGQGSIGMLHPEGWGSRSIYKDINGNFVNCYYLEENAVQEVAFLLAIDQDDVVSEFRLPVTIDQSKIKAKKVIPVNEEIILNDQKIVVESIELYPTHTNIRIFDPEENSKWITSMEYQLKGNGAGVTGEVFCGLSSLRTSDHPEWLFLNTESLYYEDLESIDITFTYAKWRSKYFVEGSRPEWEGEVTVHVEIP